MKKSELHTPEFTARIFLDFKRCLRGDYYFNDCTLCVDMCQPKAFAASRNKLSIKDDLCIGCSACVGVCPTEALGADSFEPTLAVGRLLEESKDKSLTLECTSLGACLATFDIHHLLLAASCGAQEITLQTAKCATCSLNEAGIIGGAITSTVSAPSTGCAVPAFPGGFVCCS